MIPRTPLASLLKNWKSPVLASPAENREADIPIDDYLSLSESDSNEKYHDYLMDQITADGESTAPLVAPTSTPSTSKLTPAVDLALDQALLNKTLISELAAAKLNRFVNHQLHVSDIKRMRVISQLQKKFIVGFAPVQTKTDGGNAFQLIAVDQHAADERVRLEALERQTLPRRIGQPPIYSPGPPHLVNDVWRVKQNFAQVEQLRSSLRRWGFELGKIVNGGTQATQTQDPLTSIASSFAPPSPAPDTDRNRDEDSATIHIEVLQVPVLCGTPLDRPVYLQDLIYHFVNHFPGGAVPLSFHSVLHSRACRSAIMFGDELTTDQCQWLLQELAQCKLPFNCAHGRPSVFPLAFLQKQ